MAGSRLGGQKAAQTNKERYGSNFYENIGRKGGVISRGGGFAANRELARIAGAKGGRISRSNLDRRIPIKVRVVECELCGEVMTANCNNGGCS